MIPSQEKIMEFLSGFQDSVSLADIKRRFSRYDSNSVARYLRYLTNQGVLIRTEKNNNGSAFYRPAPNASGLTSLPMWKVKIPAHTRSRVIRFDGLEGVRNG